MDLKLETVYTTYMSLRFFDNSIITYVAFRYISAEATETKFHLASNYLSFTVLFFIYRPPTLSAPTTATAPSQ